jgi:hypothetical protein
MYLETVAILIIIIIINIVNLICLCLQNMLGARGSVVC